jgi:hypothetical protein
MFWKLLPRFVCRLLIKVGIDAAYVPPGPIMDSTHAARSPQYRKMVLQGCQLTEKMCIATLVLGRDSSNKLTAVEHTTDRHDDSAL